MPYGISAETAALTVDKYLKAHILDLNQRGSAVSPPKPLDFLDMIAEARRSLDQAEHAMYEDRYAPSAAAAAWARRARDYAHERWGAGQIDDTPDDERNDPMDEPVDRFEDDPGDAGDYVEMDEEEECQL